MREDHRGDQRPDEGPDAFGQTRDDVGGGQILGRSGDRREQRGLRWPSEREAHGGGAGGHVDHRPRHVGQQRDRGRRHRQRLGEVVDGQHPIAPEAVPRERCERRDQGRWDELHDGDDARHDRASAVVREHEDRDPGRELRHVEGEERDLDADQPRVSSDRNHDPQSLPHRGHLSSVGRARSVDSEAPRPGAPSTHAHRRDEVRRDLGRIRRADRGGGRPRGARARAGQRRDRRGLSDGRHHRRAPGDGRPDRRGPGPARA